jgi:ubiquinone/menaquinone biosynthesis C-methylase UbiE
MPVEQPYHSYDAISAVYDFMVGDRKPAVEFYGSVLWPACRSMVDLGCGTGNVTAGVAKLLSELNPDVTPHVTGFDGSAQMLALARHTHPQFEWIEGQFSTLALDRTFDFAMCCYNTLQHVPPAQLALVLGRVRSILNDGGKFAFDIYQPNLPHIRQAKTDRVARVLRDTSGRRLEIREDSSFDEASGLLTINWRLVDPAGEIELAAARLGLWQHFHADVVGALHAAGFAVGDIYGDFDRSAFTAESRKQVLVCVAR